LWTHERSREAASGCGPKPECESRSDEATIAVGERNRFA